MRGLEPDRTFEVVCTSYGTVYWLPALAEWAETVAAHLEPGGVFYMADGHPFAAPFGHESSADDLRLAGPYFNEGARSVEHDGSYAGWNFGLDSRRKHGFSHPPGETVTALVEAGCASSAGTTTRGRSSSGRRHGGARRPVVSARTGVRSALYVLIDGAATVLTSRCRNLVRYSRVDYSPSEPSSAPTMVSIAATNSTVRSWRDSTSTSSGSYP